MNSEQRWIVQGGQGVHEDGFGAGAGAGAPVSPAPTGMTAGAGGSPSVTSQRSDARVAEPTEKERKQADTDHRTDTRNRHGRKCPVWKWSVVIRYTVVRSSRYWALSSSRAGSHHSITRAISSKILSFNAALLVGEQQMGTQTAITTVRLTQPRVVVKTTSKVLSCLLRRCGLDQKT